MITHRSSARLFGGLGQMAAWPTNIRMGQLKVYLSENTDIVSRVANDNTSEAGQLQLHGPQIHCQLHFSIGLLFLPLSFDTLAPGYHFFIGQPRHRTIIRYSSAGINEDVMCDQSFVLLSTHSRASYHQMYHKQTPEEWNP